ncbi:UNVERIFIED_CONTAM: histidine kinase [Acetivibrio alkalicellulosi]
MHFYFNIEIFLLIFSAIVSLFMIIFFFTLGKKSNTILSYVFINAILFIWSSGQILEFYAIDEKIKWISFLIQYIGILYLGYAWHNFSIIYSEYKIIPSKIFSIMALFPIVIYFFLLTNPYHNLFYSYYSYSKVEYGFMFWLSSGFNYGNFIIGQIILMLSFFKKKGYKRKQILLLLVASSIIAFVNTLYIFRIINFSYDPTAFSFSVTLLIFTLATLKYRFLNIVPIALRKTFDTMKESVIVVNTSNKIIDFNNSFFKNSQYFGTIKRNAPIKVLFNNIKKNTTNFECLTRIYSDITSLSEISFQCELDLLSTKKKFFSVYIEPIMSSENELLGKVLSFTDITESKMLLNELNQKNMELIDLNLKLEKYAETIEELAVTRERNRFSKDVHDTLGHTMALLISILEASNISCKKDPEKTSQQLNYALKACRNGLNELRQSISGLMDENLITKTLVEIIESLVSEYEFSGMNIVLSVDGTENNTPKQYHHVIYRLCQEALTNSLRHGRAKNVNIILRFEDTAIKLFIIDDGEGCKKINKGMGIRGMVQRVRELNGKIAYGSYGESGFNIRVEFDLYGGEKHD